MQAKWHYWQYRPDNHCWHFVRAVLREEFNVPVYALPSWGAIGPSQRRAMTKAFKRMRPDFVRVDFPKDGAIACHFHGQVLTHVGVVADGQVWHVSERVGLRKESPAKFAMVTNTEYWLWPALLS
jgi:hypothetical protein